MAKRPLSAVGAWSECGCMSTVDHAKIRTKDATCVFALGKILVEIEKKYPQALMRNSAEDEIELNVDKLPQPLFAELQAYVKSCLQAAGAGKLKKKSNSFGQLIF